MSVEWNWRDDWRKLGSFVSRQAAKVSFGLSRVEFRRLVHRPSARKRQRSAFASCRHVSRSLSSWSSQGRSQKSFFWCLVSWPLTRLWCASVTRWTARLRCTTTALLLCPCLKPSRTIILGLDSSRFLCACVFVCSCFHKLVLEGVFAAHSLQTSSRMAHWRISRSSGDYCACFVFELTFEKGPYYCGNGVDRVFGRAFVEAHYKACL